MPDTQGQRMTGCPGLVQLRRRQPGVTHLQNLLSALLSVSKKQVCEGSSGQGCCSPQAVVPSRPAASNTAPSSFILPCRDQGIERVSPTGRAVTQSFSPSAC